MKKRVICIVITLLLGLLCALPASAATDPATTNDATETVVDIEHYADGSYGVITLKDVSVVTGGDASRGTVSKTKSYKYYNSSNEHVWTVSLTATFSYTGSSATCTSATPSHTIYNSNWKVTNETASISGNSATGNFTVKRYVLLIPVETVNKTLTLTCSNTGVVT